MARIEVGGTADDLAYRPFAFAGHNLMELGAGTLTWWSAETGGTQITDLLLNGNGVSSIPIPASGRIPAHFWPDGTTQLWGSADGGTTRLLMRAPGTGGGGGSEPDATTTTKGIVELATTLEATTGTDTTRAVTAAGVSAVADTKINALDIEDVVRANITDLQLIVSATDPGTLAANEVWIVSDDTPLLETLVNAKGDLLVATGADAVARRAVGTNGQVLTADSTDSTGVKWAAAASGAVAYEQYITPVGYLAFPQRVIGTGASALTSGRAQYTSIVLQPGTYDALVINVFVAQVGGTVAFTHALYGEAADGFPDPVGGQLLSATTVLTATGDIATADAQPLVVTVPTRYWYGSLYYASSAPGTPPQLIAISSQALSLPSATIVSANVNDGWVRGGTSLTALPTDACTTGNMTITAANNVPYFGIRRSA